MGKRLGIVLVPDKQLEAELIGFSRQNEGESEYVLGTEDYLPHVTLYQAHFPESQLPTIESRVSILAHHRPFPLKTSSTYMRPNGNLWLEVALTNELFRLHELAVNSLFKLREEQQAQSLLSQKELEMFEKYGSGLVFDTFSPHFTLGKLKKPIERNFCSSGMAIALGLGQMDTNGCLRQMLKYYRLR
jgi:2'-5' RNA ligase